MTRWERVLVYGTLAAVGAGHVVTLVDSTSRSAAAVSPDAGDDDLGPARALRLVPDDARDGVALVLRNDGGRLSWGEGPSHRCNGIAFVHIGNVLSKLISSQAYLDEQETLRDELEERSADFMARKEALDKEYEGLQPGDADADEARRRYGELQQAFEEFRTQGTMRIGALRASQLEKAYRDLVAAVNVVADHLDIDVVYRFIPTDDPFETSNPEQALMAVRLRAVLRYPDELDITDAVLDELALEIE